MSEFHLRAVKEHGKSHEPHLLATGVLDAHVDTIKAGGKVLMVQEEAKPVYLQSDVMVAVNPKTTVPATLLNGGQVEFSINKNEISKLDCAYLKIAITNGTGAAATVAPAKALLHKVEIFANQGGQVVFQEDYLQLWFENQFMNADQWASYASLGNSNSSYTTAGTSIANGASAVYYIPIVSFIDSGNLYLGGLRDDLLIRFTFQSSTYTIQSGSNPTVTAATLLLRGVYEPPAVSERKARQYMTAPVLVKFLDTQANTQVLTMAASSSYSINLSAISGLVAYAWVGIRAAARTASNQLTFTETGNLTSLDIQTSTGVSMLGHYPRTPSELKNLIYPEMHENQFNLNTAALFIPFTTDPCASFRAGGNYGFQTFTGDEKLIINTNAAFTSGDYEIIFYARVYNHAIIEKGRLIKANN